MQVELVEARLSRARPMHVKSAIGDKRLVVECDVCGDFVLCVRPRRWDGACEAEYRCLCGQCVRVLWAVPWADRSRLRGPVLKPTRKMLRKNEWMGIVREYLEVHGPTDAIALGELVQGYFSCRASASTRVRSVLYAVEWAAVVGMRPLRFDVKRGEEKKESHAESRRRGDAEKND